MQKAIALDPQLSVSPQIDQDDMDQIKAAGFSHLISNRPDDEAPGQPSAEEVSSWAQEAGLEFHHLPYLGDGSDLKRARAMAETLKSGERVLAFCTSGTRSALLWAMARSALGDDIDDILEATEEAGFNFLGVAPLISRAAQAS